MALIKPKEISYMQKAYKLIFQIETSLKRHAEKALIETYGVYWRQKLLEPREKEASYYHEVVSFYGKYPPLNLIFTPSERKLLYSLTNVRNKIAHMKLISESEFQFLNQCYDLINNHLLSSYLRLIIEPMTPHLFNKKEDSSSDKSPKQLPIKNRSNKANY
jgi:hypothetical protein